MPPALVPPAVSLGDFLVDIALGAVLFVVVAIVTVVLMALVQAVLPGGDAGAEAIAAADRPPSDGDEVEPT